MRRVWLIRHGESEANAGLPTASPTTTAITAKGWEQAIRFAALVSEAPGLIVTSKYNRTKETSDPLRMRFPDVPHEEWPVHEFTYLGVSKYTNTTFEDRRPAAREYWGKADPDYRSDSEAESFHDLMSRVHGMFERLRGREENPIAIFTHGHFMRAVLYASLIKYMPQGSETMSQFRRFSESFEVENLAVLPLAQAGPEWLVGRLRVL